MIARWHKSLVPALANKKEQSFGKDDHFLKAVYVEAVPTKYIPAVFFLFYFVEWKKNTIFIL